MSRVASSISPTWPRQNTKSAASQTVEVEGQRVSQPAFLLVGVAGRRDPGLREAELDESGAV